MTFRSFSRFWVVFLYILGCEKWSAEKFASLDGLEPCRFDRVAVDRMHTFDGLPGRGQVIDAVGLAQFHPSLLGWASGLPLDLLLYQWDAVAAAAISGSDEYSGAFARDKDFLFIVYGDAFLGEN